MVHPEFTCTILQHFLAARAHYCCHNLSEGLGVTLGTTRRICKKFTIFLQIEVFCQGVQILADVNVALRTERNDVDSAGSFTNETWLEQTLQRNGNVQRRQ